MAKAASQTQFEQVTALYEERQRFEAWLAALEAKRATTPVHIYTRVHADYGARLQRVVEELRTHRTALQELESTLIDRLTALDSEEAKHRDEAAEAELRATVGRARERALQRSHRAHERRDRGAERRARTRAGGALAAASFARCRHGAAPGRARSHRSLARAEHPAPEQPRVRLVDSGAPAPTSNPDAPPAPTPSDWELSFENALGGNPAPARASVGAARSGASARAPQEPNPFDDLEFLKTMVDRNSGEHAVVNPTRERPRSRWREPAAPDALETMPTAPPVKQRPSKPLPVAASGLPLIMPDAPAPPRVEPRFPQTGATRHRAVVLKESPPEQVKTLKCQECGTLNYPTEWYCERCGAELAAL